MHITSNVRDSTRIPIGAILIVLPMFTNSEARITAITNGLAGGPEWVMNGAPLTVGPFSADAEVRIECIEGDIGWDTVYIQDLNLGSEITTLQGQYTSLSGTVSGLSGTVSGLSTTVSGLSTTVAGLSGSVATINTTLSGYGTSIGTLNTEYTGLSGTVSTLNSTVSALGVVSTANDNVIVGVGDGIVDNAPAMNAAVNDAGTFTAAGKTSARFGYQGSYRLAEMVDVHPSHSLVMQSRGGILLVPDGNMSSANADGAESALVRNLRRSPASGLNLAWGFALSGVNLDARGITFVSGAFTAAAANDTITSTAHGRPNGFCLYVTGLSNSGAGLSVGTKYFVINATANTFQLATTAGGAAIDLTADFSGTWATMIHGFRTPNADNTKNLKDGDPTFSGNKDYVAGRFEFGDIIGFPGTGLLSESTNGRIDIHSFRFLNNGGLLSDDTNSGHGAELDGNDIVVSGHSAAGNNKGFGFKIGNASGFFATTMNVWGSSAIRSLTCGGLWLNNRKLFGIGFSEFNDWMRIDGTLIGSRGGVVALNAFGSFNDLFNAEGVAIDTTVGGADPRLQAFVGLAGAQSVDLIGNKWTRTTATNKSGQPGGVFGNWQNVGGDLSGASGTAFNYFIDASNDALVNMIDTVSTAPDIKPWTSPPIAIASITQASPAVITTSAAHGLQANDLVAFADSGTLGAGLYTGVTYFVLATGLTTTAFQVANIPGGAAIATTSASSGTLKCAKLNVLPYSARTGSQINYALFDSFQGQARFGVRGNGAQSKILLGIADTDTGNITGIGPLPLSSFVTTTITSNGHGLQVGYPVVFTTTGTLPTGLKLGQQYWVVTSTTNTFQVSDVWGGNALSLAGGAGTHSFYSWYRTYGVEAGDHTLLNGNNKRNALWGSWEFDSAPQYTDGTLIRNFYNAGGTFAANVKAGIHYRRILLSGTYTTGSITLPTNTAGSAFAAMGGSQALRVVITGSGSPSLTWAFTGSGGWDANAMPAPAWIPANATLTIDLWFERDQNAWQVIGYRTDGGLLGRIDNVNVPAGTVGEQIFSKVTQASAVALTTNTLATLTSIVLTPGDWNVSANAIFSTTSTTSSSTSNVKASVGTASGAISSADGTGYQARNVTTTASIVSGTDLDSLCVPQWRITVPAGTTQTVYLNVKAATTGTVGAWGGIRAIRTT